MENISLNGKIAKAMVDIIFYAGILCVLAVPLLAELLCELYGGGKAEMAAYCVMLYVSGITGVYIVYNLKRMFKTLVSGRPFVEENVKAFKKIAVSCGVIAVVYIVKSIFMFTFGTLIVVIAFGILGLFCLTLKDLFRQAIAYKEENELTV